MTTPEDQFNLLAEVFKNRDNKVLEIEIIPSSLGSPFLKDGHFIGITKKALAGAFTIARFHFIKHLIQMSESDFEADVSKQDQKQKQSSESEIPNHVITEIMLLFDCEHLTACNWRKKWLLAAISHHETNQTSPSSPSLEKILQAELTLLQTYQCSPLHRHTKSPTLWSHRLWVLNALIGLQKPTTSNLLKLQRNELDIVLRAGELHPKNYYAFTYMRNFHSFIRQLIQDQSDEDASHVDVEPERGSTTAVLIDQTLKWCQTNPRDISGWTFAIYLLDQSGDFDIRAESLRRVLRFALDIGWKGESLWTFIDQMSRQFGLEDVITETLASEKEKETEAGTEGAGKTVSDQTHLRAKWPWRNRLSQAEVYWAGAS